MKTHHHQAHRYYRKMYPQTKPVSVSVRVKPGTPEDEDIDVLPELSVIRLGNREFYFDKVYDSLASTNDLFVGSVEAIVDKTVTGGHESTIVVNGASGTGKSYTVGGGESGIGIAYLTLQRVLELLGKPKHATGGGGGGGAVVNVAYLEVYKEVVYDVFKSTPEIPVTVHMRGANTGKYTQKPISSAAQFADLLRQANAKRPVAAHITSEPFDPPTHAVVQLEWTDTQSGKSRMIQICDLAGADDPSQSFEDRRECVSVNNAIYKLRHIIRLLDTNSNQRIPYRDSKLTRILEPTLQRRSLIHVVCTINHSSSLDTAHTLEFASRAKRMHLDWSVRSVVRDEFTGLQKHEQNPATGPDFRQKVLERALQLERDKVISLQNQIDEYGQFNPRSEELVDLSLDDDLSSQSPGTSCSKKSLFSMTAKMLGF